MFNIYRGQSNVISVPLADRATESTHDWLFVFNNDTTGHEKTFAAADTSLYFERYSEFTIVESSSENLLNATVELKPTGFWSYKIYEMPVSSPPSLNVDDALALVKEGRVKVIDTSEIENVTFDQEETKDNAVFEDE